MGQKYSSIFIFHFHSGRQKQVSQYDFHYVWHCEFYYKFSSWCEERQWNEAPFYSHKNVKTQNPIHLLALLDNSICRSISTPMETPSPPTHTLIHSHQRQDLQHVPSSWATTWPAAVCAPLPLYSNSCCRAQTHYPASAPAFTSSDELDPWQRLLVGAV